MVVRGALEPADGDLLAVNLVAAADRLTGLRAGAAQHARHDVGATVEQVRLVELAVRDQADVVGDIGARGAAYLAGNIGLVPVGADLFRPVELVFQFVWINHVGALSSRDRICLPRRAGGESEGDSGGVSG